MRPDSACGRGHHSRHSTGRNQPLFHANLGAAYLAANDLAQAEASVRRALALDGRDTRLWLALGKVLQRRARQCSRQGGLSKGFATRAAIERCRVGTWRLGSDRDALAASGTGISRRRQLGIAFADVLTRLAVTLQAQGRLTEAIAKYHEALSLETLGTRRHITTWGPRSTSKAIVTKRRTISSKRWPPIQGTPRRIRIWGPIIKIMVNSIKAPRPLWPRSAGRNPTPLKLITSGIDRGNKQRDSQSMC